MRVLVIGRGYPEVKTGMVGIFELEQAKAVYNFGNKPIDVHYMFCDNRSIFRLKQIKKINKMEDDVYVFGRNLPIGGLPNSIFDKVKSNISVSILKKYIQSYGVPDIIHLHFPIITLTDHFFDYIKTTKAKIVVTEHYSRVQNKELTPNQVNLLRELACHTDKFLCVNNELPKSIREITGVERRFEVVPNVVTSKFVNRTVPPLDGYYRFISIGRLVKGKKFDVLIKSFYEAFKDNKNVKLLIVGDGEEYSSIKSIIEKYKLSDRVTMTGFLSRERTAEILTKTDSYVSTSAFETFGVPIVEAMTCGKPVLIPDSSPLKSYITERHGLIFNQNDLVSKLRDMYNNRNKFENDKIRDFAITNFSESAVGTKLYNIYEDLLEKE
ncbi:glycosyltransferase family 4 protein [Halobacillus sp. KGW1]|uniref:glycosyltransferase family 4 protein n=1 Tax=Halobacillus sp. KGW1 TaxID=1793726 RepID=UPI000780C2B1|nr:glycosyltransferase family 4 protein [Halobacillus sp. KGW1]